MKPVTYICEHYPGLSIGSQKNREIKFHRGRFVAEKEWQVEMVEANEWFDCFIFKVKDHTTEPVPMDPIPIPRPQRDGTAAEPEFEPDVTSPPVPPPVRPEYKVSDTALALLKKIGMPVPKAAAVLDLADGDRITVKMAESLEALNE